MSADLLRRAATALRTHAGAAQIAPWVTDGAEIYVGQPGGIWVGECLDIEDQAQGEANAAYMALMHPPVAQAVACLLQVLSDFETEETSPDRPTYAAAVEVARLVLREDS